LKQVFIDPDIQQIGHVAPQVLYHLFFGVFSIAGQKPVYDIEVFAERSLASAGNAALHVEHP